MLNGNYCLMYYVKDYIFYRNAIFLCQIAANGQTASTRYVKSASCHDRRISTLHSSVSRTPDMWI